MSLAHTQITRFFKWIGFLHLQRQTYEHKQYKVTSINEITWPATTCFVCNLTTRDALFTQIFRRKVDVSLPWQVFEITLMCISVHPYLICTHTITHIYGLFKETTFIICNGVCSKKITTSIRHLTIKFTCLSYGFLVVCNWNHWNWGICLRYVTSWSKLMYGILTNNYRFIFDYVWW